MASTFADFTRTRGFQSVEGRVIGLAVQIMSSAEKKIALMVVDKQGVWDGRRWSYNNEARDAFDKERTEFNRQVEIDRKKRGKERALASIQNIYAARREALTAASEALMNGESGKLETLAAAMEIDSFRMLSRLEEGIRLKIPTSQNYDMINQGDTRKYRVSYRVPSPFAVLASEERQKLMQVDFSWDKFMDQSSSVGQAKTTQLTCHFSDLSKIPKDETVVDAKLSSFSSSSSVYQLVLECE